MPVRLQPLFHTKKLLLSHRGTMKAGGEGLIVKRDTSRSRQESQHGASDASLRVAIQVLPLFTGVPPSR
jgi:hypothetical protein